MSPSCCGPALRWPTPRWSDCSPPPPSNHTPSTAQCATPRLPAASACGPSSAWRPRAWSAPAAQRVKPLCLRALPISARQWRWSTPTRSSTTTCLRWTTTTCAAASPPATSPSATPSPSSPATPFRPSPSRPLRSCLRRPRPSSKYCASSASLSAPALATPATQIWVAHPWRRPHRRH